MLALPLSSPGVGLKRFQCDAAVGGQLFEFARVRLIGTLQGVPVARRREQSVGQLGQGTNVLMQRGAIFRERRAEVSTPQGRSHNFRVIPYLCQMIVAVSTDDISINQYIIAFHKKSLFLYSNIIGCAEV